MIAGLALAVESANTVGYTTIELVPDPFYMCAVQFEGVGDGANLTVNDLITTKNIDAVTRANRNDGAQLQVFNGTSYTLYYYISDGKTAAGANIGAPAWCNAAGRAPATGETLGNGFWVKVPTAVANGTPSVTFKGQVTDGTTQTISFAADKFVMVANPFPVDVNINEIGVTGVDAVTRANRNNGAQLQVLNGTSYTLYYYISDGKTAAGANIGAPAWCNAAGRAPADTVKVPAGASMWLKSPTAGTLTYTLTISE